MMSWDISALTSTLRSQSQKSFSKYSPEFVGAGLQRRHVGTQRGNV